MLQGTIDLMREHKTITRSDGHLLAHLKRVIHLDLTTNQPVTKIRQVFTGCYQMGDSLFNQTVQIIQVIRCQQATGPVKQVFRCRQTGLFQLNTCLGTSKQLVMLDGCLSAGKQGWSDQTGVQVLANCADQIRWVFRCWQTGLIRLKMCLGASKQLV